MNETYLKSNMLWTIITIYKGSRVFRNTTLIDFPYEGVNPDDVLDIRACSDDGEMCFYVVFKTDRDVLKLYFKHASTLHRIKMFMNRRMKKIVWEED